MSSLPSLRLVLRQFHRKFRPHHPPSLARLLDRQERERSHSCWTEVFCQNPRENLWANCKSGGGTTSTTRVSPPGSLRAEQRRTSTGFQQPRCLLPQIIADSKNIGRCQYFGRVSLLHLLFGFSSFLQQSSPSSWNGLCWWWVFSLQTIHRKNTRFALD